jgi:hypothetical protein
VRSAGEIAPWAQPFLVSEYFNSVRFSRWDDLVSEPAPDSKLPLLRGIWLYARGVALAERGRLEEASQQLVDLGALLKTPDFEKTPMGNNTLRSVLAVGEPRLAGAIAARRGNLDAIAQYDRGVRTRRAGRNDRPTGHAVRLCSLPRCSVDARRSGDRLLEDLAVTGNGWALAGLVTALEAQKTEAPTRRATLARAWARADEAGWNSR